MGLLPNLKKKRGDKSMRLSPHIVNCHLRRRTERFAEDFATFGFDVLTLVVFDLGADDDFCPRREVTARRDDDFGTDDTASSRDAIVSPAAIRSRSSAIMASSSLEGTHIFFS